MKTGGRKIKHSRIKRLLYKLSGKHIANPYYQTSRAISHEEFARFLRSRGMTPSMQSRSRQPRHSFLKIGSCLGLILLLILGVTLIQTSSPSQSTTQDSTARKTVKDMIAFTDGVKLDNINPAFLNGLLTLDQTVNQKLAPAVLAQELQNYIDQWAASLAHAQIGLTIYDLDHDSVLASYNPDTSFEVASLYKLFYAYDGYVQIDAGMIAGEQPYLTSNHVTQTYARCLNLIISMSDNICAERMQNPANINRVLALIRRLELTRTTGAVLTSTAHDITELLKLYYHHPDLSSASWEQLADSLLNQGRSDLRQGLPNGFSIAKVYAKAGFNSQIYNEAAIIEFPLHNRHFSIAVLTRNLSSPQYLTTLGTEIEQIILKYI